MLFSGQLFFSASCALTSSSSSSSRKKKRFKYLIDGGSGSTWDHNFYMGMHNSNLMEGIFDLHLRIKDMVLKVCLYREAIRLQCFTPTRYVRGVATRT